MKEFSLAWEYALGKPSATALFRSQPEDFYVDEVLGQELTGSGEHVVLHVQKRGDNTAWVVKQIAHLAGVNPSDVGYCGLKDRHAVTRQWFSVYLPKGEEPNWKQLNSESITVLDTGRHCRKLRRGSHQSNHFKITLREVQSEQPELVERLQRVANAGVPNYFGEQRFGIDAGNLDFAERLLVGGEKIKNRQRRGLVMSAARSYLFNNVLSERIALGNWRGSIDGEVEQNEKPTGPLWGRGRLASLGDCLSLEHRVLEPLADWCDGLEHVGLKQERRELLLMPGNFQWELEGETLIVSFDLPPGTYATAVLRELCVLDDVSHRQVVV